MKPKSILISLMIILLTGISISSYAKGDDEPHHNSPHAMRNHHAHMQEMHTMLMNVMLILRDLNHKPSAADKNQLNTMINRLDEIITEQKIMREHHALQKRHGWISDTSAEEKLKHYKK